MGWLIIWALLAPQNYDDLVAAGVAALEEERLEEAATAFRRAIELAPSEPAPKILLAQVLIDTRRPKLAFQHLQNVRGPAASDGRVLCLRGRALLGLGETDAAILELETALEKLGDDPACREALGAAKLLNGDAQGALDVVEPLVSSTAEGERSTALNATYGIALAQTGRHEEAVAPLRSAIELQPRRARALFHLGRVLQSLERFGEAAEVYERGLDFPPPENVRFALGLARCRIRLGRFGQARQGLDDLISQNPDVGRAWLLRGVVAFEETRYEDSAADIEKAIAKGYRGTESDLRLGMALGSAGHYDEAQTALDAALLRDPDLATAYYYKGLFLFEEGETLARGGQNPFGVHGIRLLARSASLLPNPRTSLALAEAYLRFGQYQRAREAAQKARVVPALAARAYHTEALAHHELLEYELAEEGYREALASGGDSAELYHDFGNLLSVMGRWEEARKALTEALARRPELSRALVQMGIVQMNLGDHEAALEDFGRALAAGSENAEAWFQKGVVESRQGDAEAAVSSWQQALEIDPEQPRLYYRMGAELVKLGRLDERKALLEEFQVRERKTELASQRSEQLQNLLSGAVAASDAENDTRALTLLEEARAFAPHDPLPYVYLGDFYLSREKFLEAEQILEAGIQEIPGEISLYQTLLSVQQGAGDTVAADETRKRIRALVEASK